MQARFTSQTESSGGAVFLPGDLGIQKASARLGLPKGQRGIEAVAARWRPWRSYAAQHLWASLEDAPAEERERREETVA